MSRARENRGAYMALGAVIMDRGFHKRILRTKHDWKMGAIGGKCEDEPWKTLG